MKSSVKIVKDKVSVTLDLSGFEKSLRKTFKETLLDTLKYEDLGPDLDPDTQSVALIRFVNSIYKDKELVGSLINKYIASELNCLFKHEKVSFRVLDMKVWDPGFLLHDKEIRRRAESFLKDYAK